MKKKKIHLYDVLPGVNINTLPGDEKKAMQPITKRNKILKRKSYIDKVYSEAIKKFNKQK